MGRGRRTRLPSTRLRDFLCSTTTCKGPPPRPPVSTSKSSGTPYSLSNFIDYHHLTPKHKIFLSALSAEKEPSSYASAVKDPRWRDAMQEEIEALERNGTWTIEDLPPGSLLAVNGCTRSSINLMLLSRRFKARFVLCGNNLQEKTRRRLLTQLIKWLRTFLGVAALKREGGSSIKLLFIMPFSTATCLRRFICVCLLAASYPNKVCRLRQSLYVLKQAPRNCFAKRRRANKAEELRCLAPLFGPMAFFKPMRIIHYSPKTLLATLFVCSSMSMTL